MKPQKQGPRRGNRVISRDQPDLAFGVAFPLRDRALPTVREKQKKDEKNKTNTSILTRRDECYLVGFIAELLPAYGGLVHEAPFGHGKDGHSFVIHPAAVGIVFAGASPG